MLQVLIVEDNAAYRGSLHQLLGQSFQDMQIDEAADGVDALRLALAKRFDLIFMDIRLPRGNGLHLTKAVKTVYPDSVICVVSSYAILEYREAAYRNGADHFMVKGESTETEIVDLVQTWCGNALLRLR